jgi:hypothetical protein
VLISRAASLVFVFVIAVNLLFIDLEGSLSGSARSPFQ